MKRNMLWVGGVSAMLLVGLLAWPMMAQNSRGGHPGTGMQSAVKPATTQPAGGCCGMEKNPADKAGCDMKSTDCQAQCQKACDEVGKSIDAAIAAVQAGEKDKALAELNKAKAALASCPCLAKAFVNAKCPIMGTPIEPAKVPAELTQEYKGQKIAFCCGGCPAKWDALPEADKDAKLKAAQ